MIRFFAVCLAFLTAGSNLRAVSPDPSSLAVPIEQTNQARLLVKQLADNSFRVRDHASRELARMGRFAIPALVEGRSNPDPEVRSRSATLLPRAEADEMQARVEVFLADAKNEYQHQLPGWAEYRQVAGDSLPARELFIEIVKNRENHDLLLSLRDQALTPISIPGSPRSPVLSSAGPAPKAKPGTGLELAKALVRRRIDITARMNPELLIQKTIVQQPLIPDYALLLLAESLISERLAPCDGYQYHISNFLYQGQQPGQPNYELIRGNGKYGPTFRKLIRNWVETRDGVQGLSMVVHLTQSLQLGDEIGARSAAKLLLVSDAQPWLKLQGITMLMKFDGKRYLTEVTRQFDDESLLMRGGPGNPNPDIMVKDAALAAALLMTGQDAEKYGYQVVQSNGVKPGTQPLKTTPFNYSFFRFVTDAKSTAEEKRTHAFAKWQTWELTNDAGLLGAAAASHQSRAKYPVKQ